MNTRNLILISCLAVALGGCSNMSSTQKRTGGGAAIGAAGGALIGSASGHHWTGAAIGTAVGATSGYLASSRAKKAREKQEGGEADSTEAEEAELRTAQLTA